MTEKCFKKCVGKPGTSLDNSEQVIAQNYLLTYWSLKFNVEKHCNIFNSSSLQLKSHRHFCATS